MSFVNNTAAIAASQILAAREAWGAQLAERRAALKEGVVKALLGQEGLRMQVIPGQNAEGRQVLLLRGGVEVCGRFFGRYGTMEDRLAEGSGYGRSWEFDFRRELEEAPIEGVVYKWEASSHCSGGDMKAGIGYDRFWITVDSQEVSASTPEAAEAFAERLLAWEEAKYLQSRRWLVERCVCSRLTEKCDRCLLLKEEAILKEAEDGDERTLSQLLSAAHNGQLKDWQKEVLLQQQGQTREERNQDLGRAQERARDLSVELGKDHWQVQQAWDRVDLIGALLGGEDMRLELVQAQQDWKKEAAEYSHPLKRDWLSDAFQKAMSMASEEALKGLPRTFSCNSREIWREASVVRISGAQLVAQVDYCHHGSERGGRDVKAFAANYVGGNQYLLIVENHVEDVVLFWSFDMKLPAHEEVLAGREIPANWPQDSDDV
jgi:hypothetical protein